VTITRIAVQPGTPRVLYVGTPDAGVYKSRNGGRTWSKASMGLPVRPPCDQTICPDQRVAAFAVAPRDPANLYVVFDRQVYKSQDGARSWKRASHGMEGERVESLVQDPNHPTVLLAGTWTGILKSVDGGASWTRSDKGLPPPSGEFRGLDLAIDPRDGALYAVTNTDGVFRSTDGGQSWNEVNEGLPILSTNLLAIDYRTPGTVFAATVGVGIWSRRF
jgi:hypothetical protein